MIRLLGEDALQVIYLIDGTHRLFRGSPDGSNKDELKKRAKALLEQELQLVELDSIGE